MKQLTTVAIPYFPQPPPLTHDLTDEITSIVFDAPQEPEPCDLIFIFGGSHPGLWIHGAQAYQSGLGREVIATGGHKPTALVHHTWQHGDTPEALVIREELIRTGVPAEKIHVESRSTNTLENVLFAQEVYDLSAVGSILAVCRSYGAGRQCRTLRHHTPKQIRIIPYSFDTNVGSDGPVVTRGNWMSMERSRSYVFGQFLKILQYGQLGHLEPVASVPDKLIDAVNMWIAAAVDSEPGQ